jgi:hypothetical protein
MAEFNPRMKTSYRFSDFLYWNLLLSVPLITASVGVYRYSVTGFICYILFGLLAVGLLYKFFCSHCPHYINADSTTKCMFFWGVPRFFPPQAGPMSFMDKTISTIGPLVLLLFPLIWLVYQPGLLIVYVLSWAAFFTSLRRFECSRCIHADCPVNTAAKYSRSAYPEIPNK